MWVAPRLTPIDVQRKKFSPAMRGYGIPEVDAFLDELSDQLGWLQHVIANLRAYPQAAWELPARLRQVLRVIRLTEFPRVMHGYAIGDVNDFLDEVAYELQGFLQQIDAAQANATRALPAPDRAAAGPTLSPRDVADKQFTRVLGGYAAGEVDAFMDHMADAMAAVFKHNSDLHAAFTQARMGQWPPDADELLQIGEVTQAAPTAIENHEFSKAVRGYAMHEVDAFMDELAASLAAAQRDTMQLRQELYRLRPPW